MQEMTDLRKHVGRIINTEQRCVIVFMQLPGDEGHALVINTESLPPRYEQALIEIVDSPEGQQAQDLGYVMSRRLMSDTGLDLLTTFHRTNLLRRERIDNIMLLPRPNMGFPLRKILEGMGRNVNNTIIEEQQVPDTKWNPYTNNQEAQSAESKLGIAKGLIVEAQMLEMDAQRKRQHAYTLAPELKPETQAKGITMEEVANAMGTRGQPKSADAGPILPVTDPLPPDWKIDDYTVEANLSPEDRAMVDDAIQREFSRMANEPAKRGRGRPRKNP